MSDSANLQTMTKDELVGLAEHVAAKINAQSEGMAPTKDSSFNLPEIVQELKQRGLSHDDIENLLGPDSLG